MNVNQLHNCPLHCAGLGLLAVIGVAEALAVVNPAHKKLDQGLDFSLWGDSPFLYYCSYSTQQPCRWS